MTRKPDPVIPGKTQYLRKNAVMLRYALKSPRTLERAWKKEPPRIPPPTIYRGVIPLWSEAVLDAHDSALAQAAEAKRDETSAAARAKSGFAKTAAS